ncbi:putative N-acetyltransferase YhbS [Mucilaginibacter rubeus]|uniref:GNAT family N-acetyltransferase n=1 Tax=Mucilaginibacter rubeus TaxID=2027860 RepID=UPI00339944DD
MITATKSDKKKVVEILTEAFTRNQSVNYIIKHKQNLGEIRALMSYSFDTCQLFGQVLLSNERNACALILHPQNKIFNLKSLWLDIELIFRAIGVSRIKTAMWRESQIKKLQPKIEMCYVWFIGVDPKSQHHGIGTQLMHEIIVAAESRGLPLFLETSALENLPWYQKLGFELYDQLDLSYTLYFLRR